MNKNNLLRKSYKRPEINTIPIDSTISLIMMSYYPEDEDTGGVFSVSQSSSEQSTSGVNFMSRSDVFGGNEVNYND